MDFFSNHKKLVVAVVVIACLSTATISYTTKFRPTFLSNTIGFVITPIQKASTNIGRFFEGKINSITNVSKVESENEYLKQQIDELTAINNNLKLMGDENIKLNKLLEISQKYGEYHKIGAHVIARDVNNWYDEFIIDKGTDNGLQVNMVVLANGGLVGRLVEVNKNYSKVLPLVDDTSSVSAKNTKTDDIGFVKGGDTYLAEAGYCKMEYLDADAGITIGDEITTSYLSDIYPPGIIIGTVEEVTVDPNNLTKSALIKTAVDFNHLDTVLVIDKLYKNIDLIEESLFSEEKN